jgi:lysophospholipase L1-like esterase
VTVRLVTLGDSSLDSRRYSGGVGTSAPDILARTLGVELHHLARDGHTVNALVTFQLPELPPPAPETVLVVSIGGNDLMSSIYSAADHTRDFAKRLDDALRLAIERLRPEKTLLANIYDPSGHDPALKQWITDLDRARALLARFNEIIAAAAVTHGAKLVDLHAPFVASAGSQPPWAVNRIEPSAEGAKQIARLLGEALLSA